MSPTFRTWLIDVAERAAWTFVQAFLAVFVVTDVSSAESALIAGLAAALAVVKGAVAKRNGNPDSASTVF